MWFKKKTLEEKIIEIRNFAKRKKLSGDANLVYVVVAIQDFGWDDAANYFLTEHIKESVRLNY